MKSEAVLTPKAITSSFFFTTMQVRVLIAVHMALLTVTSGTQLEDKRVLLRKCCDVNQMLSPEGKSCVEAGWQGDSSLQRDAKNRIIPSPKWVRRWLPPGLPMENITFGGTGYNIAAGSVVPVNASSLWDPALLKKERLFTNTVAFLGKEYVARPKPGGGLRIARHCVDAAAPPLGPFALKLRTYCSKEECVHKCCYDTQLLRNNEGHWKCEEDAEGFWTPFNSSLSVFDREFPYTGYGLCENPRLLPFEKRYVEWARHTGGSHDFHFSTWDTCFDFYRSSNGSPYEGVFYCEYPRITRGVYWLLRPLCFLSTLLLTASLLSVACNKSMRRKIHGRCLACHAASLLVFNIGQSVYYITISDRLDSRRKDDIPPDLQTVCKYYALSMYFVLTSAWIWLTAMCANMARGFRLHMPRLDKGCGKRFMVISAFAWGLPAVLTITCSIFFTQPNWRKTPAWYTPSLMEARVCYIEPINTPPKHAVYNEEVSYMKYGTALFYYGPMCCLAMCNIISLALTLRKVQYLKRGNSVLRREVDQIPLGQRHTEGNNPPTSHTATGNGQTPEVRNKRGTTVDAKTIKLYIKMVLISGGIELFTEVMMWCTTHENFTISSVWAPMHTYSLQDRDLAYRAAGYVTDFFRAAVVTWLAAPEGGYLGLIMRMLRRDKREKTSAGAGDAGRRKHNVA